MRICGLVACSLLVLFSGCSRKPEIRIAQMGEKAEIGPFIYQAIETRWPMTLQGRTAKERFFVVRVSATNSGSNEITIPGFEVVDDAGGPVGRHLEHGPKVVSAAPKRGAVEVAIAGLYKRTNRAYSMGAVERE